jgi:hypothetical protein
VDYRQNKRRKIMYLAEAIRKNKVTLAAAQNTYKQNVSTVNMTMASVFSSTLPNLNTPPPDWNDFVTAHEQAMGIALDWGNTVMGHLLQIPDDVRDYNDVISAVLQDALIQANTLVNQPNNHSALQSLNVDLGVLSRKFNLVTTFIVGAITAVQQFRDQLPAMSALLQSIAAKSAADANADQAQIDDFNAKIGNLRSDISSLTNAIIALAIADGVAITIGIAVTIAAFPVGALAWFALAPAVAAATTYIALDAKQIESDKAQIDALTGQITGITADVATLSVLANNYSTMVSQAEGLETNLQAILAEWQTLESDVNLAVGEIGKAQGDVPNFSLVVEDINGAISEWNDAFEQAGALHLDIVANNAVLQFGMSSEDVQSALAGGQTMDIITYYNSVG